MARSHSVVQIPGDTQHNVDAALQAAASGGTHRVKKHGLAPPAPLADDPMRPEGVGVNAKAEISYDEAMAMLASGELKRTILTPDGWVCPPEPPHPSHRTPPRRG
jgi:hypothetical protein